MGVRIQRIRVNRGGPLQEDFVLEPRDLNLIYGPNETGKTYIVETLINLLFRTGRGAPVDWVLRDWDRAGRVVLSGLGDGLKEFTLGSDKLDDYWTQESGFPRSLSSLLVVKAGETHLKQEPDGVGRNILKDCLSGEGILDAIDEKIPATLRAASIVDGTIEASRRGDPQRRDGLRAELDSIDSLLTDAEAGYASTDIHALRREQDEIETALETQRTAKRHHAWRLCQIRDKRQEERASLPTDEGLSELESRISLYEQVKSTADEKAARLKGLESTSGDYEWAEKALMQYQELLSQRGAATPISLYLCIILAFLAGVSAVLAASFDFTIVLYASAAVAIACTGLLLARVRKTLAATGFGNELDALKAEFNHRFGVALTDVAALSVQVDRLKRDHDRADDLHRELHERLLPDLAISKESLEAELARLTGKDTQPEEWRGEVGEMRKRLRDLEAELGGLREEFAFLDVDEAEFVRDDPGIAFDRKEYADLESRLEEHKQRLGEETAELDGLKRLLQRETGTGSQEWEKLIDALRDKRDATALDYREITAKILASIHVHGVIEEYREAENARIARALRREEVIAPLRAATGRYTKARYDEERGAMVLTTDRDEEFCLASMSTGAREQVYIALRVGFASIAMEGGTAFLILDDAYQHSDWTRRQNLIGLTLGLAQIGWQVFYFAMDDHMRELFRTAGRQLGERFTDTTLPC